MNRFINAMTLVGLTVLIANNTFGQDYPNKTIRLVTSPAGGGGDFLARMIAQGISGPLTQAVIVDNKPSGLVGETVASAPPDGYTMLLLGNILWFEPLMQKVSYDPLRDFAPIAMVGQTPNVLVVHPMLPVKSVNELLVLAKLRPGELNYASTGVGSISELAAELFNSMAAVRIVGVPYKGAAPALNAAIGGEVQVMFVTAASVIPHVKSGRLKALAVTSAEPSVLVPGMPTVSASGLPGYESVTTYGMLAPAKTPASSINRLNQEILRTINKVDMKSKFVDIGVEVAGSSPEGLAFKMKAEMASMGKIIKDASIPSSKY